MPEKKYTSNLCIDGKRIGLMRHIAKAAFQESFLSIEVTSERFFLIRITSDVDKKILSDFMNRYKLCKVKIYQPIEYSALMTSRRR